jgi:hypothetical protein
VQRRVYLVAEAVSNEPMHMPRPHFAAVSYPALCDGLAARQLLQEHNDLALFQRDIEDREDRLDLNRNKQFLEGRT